MPIEKSRAEYLQALLNQRKQLNANDNNMLNPSVPNDLEQQAITTTNFNNKTSVNDIPDERKYASNNTDNDNWFTNLINKANGFIMNIANSFLEGVGSAFEGIIDLGATAIGSLGEATGWYESDPFDEFVEHNYAKDFADFNTDVIGGGLPGIVNMIRNTAEYGSEYWQDAFSNPSVVKSKYHTGMYSDTFTPNREVENGFEEFAMGVSQSIGMMLPSIVIPGGAGLSGVAAKGASLGIMGAGAAGKGSEEALNEGASTSQALGYGLASGGIEVASELVVGKALGAVGLGTGKIMGVIGGKETVKIGSKAFIKELAKDMFEEGMEEVFSATLEPLTKTIYKGSEALEQYKSKDYWLGTNGHFNESVLGQFTSGAVTAGITGGAVKVVNKATVTSKVGNEGYIVVNKWQEILQNDADLQKAKKGTDEYNRLNENSAKLWAEFMELEDKFINNGNNSQIKNMAQILGNPNEYAKYITTDEETTNNDLKSYLKELQKNTDSYEKRTTRDFFTNIQNRYGTDYKLEFGEVKDNNYAYVDSKNKVIRINDSIVNEKGGALLAHEYFGHVLGDSLSSGTRSMLYNSIKNTEWYKKIEKDLVKAYQVNDTYYQNLNDTKSKNNYYQDEVIAKYLEEVFGNKDTADSIKHLKKVFSQPTLLDRVLSVFNKGRDKFNTPNIVKEYAKVINSTIDSLYSLNKNDSLLKALFKEKNGYKLNDSENKLKEQYKNLFDLVKENKSQPQVAYSKNMDSDGNKLSTEQEKYFKDSKARDENGNLLVLYHGTASAGFTVFDSDYTVANGIFFTDSLEVAKNYSNSDIILNKENINDVEDKGLEYSNYQVYANIVNPLIVDAKGNYWDEINVDFLDDTTTANELSEYARKNGYDGVIIKNVSDGEKTTRTATDVIVFDSNQVKLIDNLNPTDNEDIRYSKKIDNLKGKVNRDTNVSYKITFGNGKDDYNVKRNKTFNVTIEELAKRMEATTEKRWNSTENVKIEISVKNGNEVVDTITITDYKELKKYIKRLYKLQQESLNETTENSKPLNNQETAKETKNEIVTSNQNEKSKDLFDVDLSQEKYEVGKEKTKSSPNTYKSIETTKDIIELLKTRIAGDGFNLSFPKTYRDFMNKTFAELNKVKDIDKTVDRIMNLLKQTTVEYFDEEQNKYVKLGNLEAVELVDPKEWNNLKKDVKRMIQYATETEAKSKETLQFEKTIDRLTNKAQEYGERIGNIRKLNNRLNRIKKNIGQFFEFTDDEIGRNGLNELYRPFANLKGTDKGFKVGNLKEELNKVLEWYNPETINERFETLPYNVELHTAIDELYQSLGEPIKITTKTGQERVLRGNLDTEQVEKVNKILEMINTEIRNMTKDSIDNKTYATASFDTFMANRTEKGLLGNTIKKWKRGFAPSYTLIREMFGGDTAISRLITTDVQKATNDNIMYKGGYNDALNKKIKELDIKKNIFNKKININGYEMTYDQALYLYISLNTETNFNEIDKSGFEFGKDKDKLSGVIGVGEAQTYKDLLEDKLPSNLKKLADYLQTSINTEIKQDYIKWYEMRYGKFEGRNELGKIGEKSYWMLNRSYQFATSAEKIVKTPAGIFKNSISRVNSDNAILLGGALSSYTTYIDRLGTEIYLKPIYRKVFQILNTKINGTTIYKELVRTGAMDSDYLKKTLNDIIGVQDNGANNDLLSKMMSAFSVAKLSLNIGSMMKQFASIWTSNIPLRQSAKGILTRMFNNEAKTEFRKLVDEIGGLKYREGNNAVVTSNVGTLKGTTEKIADVGMFGIKKMDYFTIGTGVYSLMVIGQNQYGFKIGTQENIDFVKEHWTEFELSQIGSSALSKSALSRGDYGGLTRAIFSFMQGANRAAFGSMINKVALYKRNHNLSKAELKSNLEKYKQEVKDFESNSKYLDENGKFDEFKVTDENERNQYISLKSQLMKAQDKYDDYINYEIVNGKSKYGIPVQVASGLIAQGIFVALINELMKHIKGKKDWDEWDIAELGTNIGLAISVDWIPFVNVIENLIKGYDVQVPAIEIMNEMVDVINNAKSGNWRTAIRQLALLLGDSTGIPFQTLYDYIYGSIKPFNPRIAYEMNSVLYGSSIQSATTTLKKYVEKNDLSNTTEMIDLIMNNFKLNSDNTINKELAKLYMNGYTDVLPKSYMTEYTDDKGNKVSLNAKQIETFRKSYNEAAKSIKELMNVTDYQNMTDEEKSKVIKKIYDSYYTMAKAKLLKIKADTKLGNYLLYSTQNAKIGQISLAISKINSITDSKTKTRKELVFDYINKLHNFSRGEKLLLLHLCNYSSQVNANILKAYLKNNNGMTNTNIKEFLG